MLVNTSMGFELEEAARNVEKRSSSGFMSGHKTVCYSNLWI